VNFEWRRTAGHIIVEYAFCDPSLVVSFRWGVCYEDVVVMALRDGEDGGDFAG